MTEGPTNDQIRAWLQSRQITLDLPGPLERRLRSAARRIEREDRQADLAEEDRIDAERDFEHVIVGMIERGVEGSEDDDGLRADPWTGRLSAVGPKIVDDADGYKPQLADVYNDAGELVRQEPWMVKHEHLDEPTVEAEPFSWALGFVLLYMLAVVVLMGIIGAVIAWL